MIDGGGSTLPDGQYVLQIRGLVGSAAFYAPSPAPFTPAQMAAMRRHSSIRLPTGTYYPVPPVRILDTRIGLGLSGAFSSGVSRAFGVGGTHGVPSNAIAVTGNLTVTLPTVQGWVRLGSTRRQVPARRSTSTPATTVPMASLSGSRPTEA